MTIVKFIGDCHGKFAKYKTIIKDGPPSIQVGDMGVGFFRNGPDGIEPLANPPHALMVAGGHRFLRGNHDNPAVCKRHTQWIPDGTVENDMMFIGGAFSIDRACRTEGYDWWPDEELSIADLGTLVDVYAAARPRIMVTHDCPESIADAVCKSANMIKFNMPSRTRQALQAMLEIHRPATWCHGHWHRSFDAVIDGTRFICLDELGYKDIDV